MIISGTLSIKYDSVSRVLTNTNYQPDRKSHINSNYEVLLYCKISD